MSIFFYGLAAGAFGFLGKESIKRFSGMKFLVHTQEFLPVRLRTMFFSLYIREILFYLSLTVIPLITGLLISTPLSSFKIFSVLKLFCMLTLAFLAGISFSYLATSLYRVNLRLFLIIVVLSICLAPFLVFFFNAHNIFLLFTTYDFACLAGFVLFNSALATVLITESTELEKFKYVHKLKPSKILSLNYSPFLIKEFIDLKRSNTLPKMLFSFLFPLVLLSALFWFIEQNIEIGFGSVSYAIFIGFFCLVIYSWLNNIEYIGFYDSLPITVPHAIKIKFKTHFCIASTFLLAFVVVLSALTNELYLLPVALLVGFSNLIYISLAVAYLTGLRVNAYLFDPKILIKFCIFALLPQVPLSVLSFTPTIISIIFIVFGCLLLWVASSLLWKGIDKKWEVENFTF
jgi:hypothetical protein